MSQYIKDSIKKNLPHFKKYKKYIEDNDWRFLVWDGVGKPKTDVEIRKSEFDVQNQLALAILNRMKLFVKKAEGDHHLKIFKDFTKQALDIINTHTERADDYISVSDISKIEDVDLRASEIEFHNHLYTTVSKIDDTIASLNIKDDTSQGDGIEFWDNKKAPLTMHKKISKAYPEVQRRLDAMGIDFITPPNNDMLLYTKDVPEWNSDKHYWEQDKETLQFYVNEYKKLESGIEIDGLYISGWQYYHMNIFTTQYPIEKVNPVTKEVSSDNVIGVPPFRDNEFWVMENFEKARKTDKMLFLAATRRAAKTTMLASRLGYASTIGKLNLICAGGSTKDLDQIETNFKIDSQNKNTAFRIPNINDSWDKKVELGLKRKDGKSIVNSILHVINLNKGGEKSSEILAGYTPDEVIIDEIMKLPFTDQLAALKPALDSPYGKRATVVLCGCVCAGTKVYTNSGKVVNIEDIQKEEGILGYNGKGISKEPITWIKPPNKKSCYRITTTGNNTIECSNDHPLLTSSATNYEKATFKKTEDLKKGDFLYLTYDAPIFGDLYNTDARLLGLLVGDGYNSKTGSELSLEGEDVYNYLLKSYNLKVMKEFTTQNSTTYRRVYIKGSGKITKFAGIDGLVKTEKTFPKNIDLYNKESLCDFLGGYFDADGSVTFNRDKNTLRIRLNSISVNLIESLKFNLLKLGIDSTISLSNRNICTLTDNSRLPIYELSISKHEDILKFYNNIYLIDSRKQCKIENYINNKETPIRANKKAKIKTFEKTLEDKGNYFVDKKNLDNLRRLSIKSIEYIGEKDVYNLTAGNTNTYIANGFITHNTAGNEQLAKDAFTVLSDPTANDVLEMAWETLDSRVPLEYRTWKKRPFGTFIPGQMSAKQGLVKIDSNLKEYLKLEDAPNLEKIKIKVTDWKVAKETIEKDREKVKKDHKLLTKETLYFPIDPEEMLLSSKLNPFPREYAVKHLDKIRQLGLTGKKADVVKIDGKLKIDFSQKQLPKFPHIGGFHDSPVIFFEEPPEVKPPRGLYVIGLDDYKQEQSDTDSLGCFVVYKRQSGGDEWGDRIVAIYTSRPDPHSKFHKIGFLLAEAYNADVLMENEDMDFKLYLDGIRKTEEYLVPSFNLAGDLTINSNTKRAYGISPKGNKSAILSKVISYCNEELSSEDENGETITGIERINDEMLLEEIINYKDGANHDRITTFGIALIMAHKLNSEWVEAKLSDNRPEQVKKTHHIKRVLGGSRRSRLLG